MEFTKSKECCWSKKHTEESWAKTRLFNEFITKYWFLMRHLLYLLCSCSLCTRISCWWRLISLLTQSFRTTEVVLSFSSCKVLLDDETSRLSSSVNPSDFSFSFSCRCLRCVQVEPQVWWSKARMTRAASLSGTFSAWWRLDLKVPL